MKTVLGFMVLVFGLGACAVSADTGEPAALSSVAAEVSASEPASLTPADETSASQACPRIWECRDCGNFRTQNILVDACTGDVVRVRACGEECF